MQVRKVAGDFGGNMKEWSKSSPRAKAVDWGNFRKGYMKCENDGERLFCAYEYLCEPFLTDDYKAADGKRVDPRLHHGVPVRDLSPRPPE